MPTYRDTSNLTARKYSVADAISILDAEKYPLLAILTNAGKDPVSGKGASMKKISVDDPEFKWYEDTMGYRSANTTTGQSGKTIGSAGQTIVLATGEGARISAGDVIRFVTSGYTFLVTLVSTDTLTLSAELGGASSTVDLSSLEFWVIGNSNAEGGAIRNVAATTPVEKVGYCQIFKRSFSITETAKNTKTLIKENDQDYQRRKNGIDFMVDVEYAFLFSKKTKITGSNGKPQRFTDSILNLISTYATSNVDTEAEFEAFLENAFAHGSKTKYALCGPAFISMVNTWAKNKLQILPKDKTYGVTILQYVSAHGTLNLIKHDLLTGTRYGDYCIVLDLAKASIAVFRDVKLKKDFLLNGEDGSTEEYIAELGLKLEQESCHAVCSKSTL